MLRKSSPEKTIHPSHGHNQLGISFDVWYIVHEYLANWVVGDQKIPAYIIEFKEITFETKAIKKPIQWIGDALFDCIDAAFKLESIGASISLVTALVKGVAYAPFGAHADVVRYAHHNHFEKSVTNEQLKYVLTLFGRSNAKFKIVKAPENPFDYPFEDTDEDTKVDLKELRILLPKKIGKTS